MSLFLSYGSARSERKRVQTNIGSAVTSTLARAHKPIWGIARELALLARDALHFAAIAAAAVRAVHQVARGNPLEHALSGGVTA